ncbi:hypothetical protein [Lysinibacillus xylanilyticus]|uniref:hypothetical protein n=1 Tax=Lysinibacillus xylanilyticus TaxID=582475 RepID=UPI0036DA6B1D
MKLIDLLKNLPTKPTSNGNLILFSDIVNTCKLHGQDNHHSIEQGLKDLENKGQLKIIYVGDDPGTGLLAGIQINP